MTKMQVWSYIGDSWFGNWKAIVLQVCVHFRLVACQARRATAQSGTDKRLFKQSIRKNSPRFAVQPVVMLPAGESQPIV